MKQTTITNNKDRQSIFSLFVTKKYLRFRDIENTLSIRSNLLSYHLDKMVADNILEKEQETYKLTKKAETFIPLFASISNAEQHPISIVVVAVISKQKICLLKREKRPYKNYWGMIGGKIKLHETIEESAIREVFEETGLRVQFKKISRVLHERLLDDKTVKHAFVIFFCVATTKESTLTASAEGSVAWFDLKHLPENIIPSDKYMIQKIMNQKTAVTEVTFSDKNEKIESMEILTYGNNSRL